MERDDPKREGSVRREQFKSFVGPRREEDRNDQEAYGKSVYSRKNRARTLRRNEEGSIPKHEKKAEKKKRCTEVMEEDEEESFKQLMEKMKVGAPAREELAEAMKLKESAVCKLNCGHSCRDGLQSGIMMCFEYLK